MNKKEISEAICALPDGAVVRRRKSFFMPVVLLLAGVLLIGMDAVAGTEWNNNLRSALVFVGGVAAVVGAMVALARACGGGAPYHTASKRFLRYEEWYYDRQRRQEVASYVESGELRRLRVLERSQVPAVAVAVYSTPDGRFAAMQAYEYTDLEYRPLTGMKVVNCC